MTEYEAIREKSASQKRDTERALTRFVAKTSDTHSLFLTEDTIFPCNIFFKFLNLCNFLWKACIPTQYSYVQSDSECQFFGACLKIVWNVHCWNLQLLFSFAQFGCIDYWVKVLND